MIDKTVADAISASGEHVIAEVEALLAGVQRAAPASQEVAAIRGELQSIARDLREHIKREEDAIANAFPGGNLSAHRVAHEQMMEASREETKFWRELRMDLAKKGIVGLTIILVGLVLVGVTVKLGLAR